MTAIGTAGAAGTGITVTPALATAHASGAQVLDYAGPSALIMKAVVDHADGTRETFVSDGTWKVSKAAEFTTATVTTRNGDAGDKAERYDARNEQPGWDDAGFDDSAWQPAYAIGPHPRPLNALRRPTATSTPRSAGSSTRRSTRRRSPSWPTAASWPTSARSAPASRSSSSTTASPAARW